MIPGEAIAVALITGGFGVIVAMLQRQGKENRQDHGIVQSKLDDLRAGHERIEGKIDNHVTDHAKGAF